MTGLPSGFSRHEVGRARLVLRDDVARSLLGAGMGSPESLRASATVRFEGRGRPFGIDVAGGVFVRPYLHGGLLRKVTADRYAGDHRFLAELRITVDAEGAGVPVTQALGYVSRPAALGLRRGWFLSRLVAGGRDLLGFLGGSPAPRARREALGRAGRAVRALHDGGFEHVDLHLKNLLVDPAGEVLVLDLDRARRHESISRRRRLAGLLRFDRFADKRAVAGDPVSRVDRLRVLRAYAGDDWPPRDEVRELAKVFATHIARHRAVRVEATPTAAGGAR